MKYRAFILVSTLFLVSCQTKETDSPEVANPSIEGTVTIQSGEQVKMIESDKEWDSGISKLEVKDEFDPTKEVSKFDNLKLRPNEAVKINFERQPKRMEVYVIDQVNHKEKVDVNDSTLKVSNEKGYYMYQLDVYWDEGIKNYTFDADIK